MAFFLELLNDTIPRDRAPQCLVVLAGILYLFFDIEELLFTLLYYMGSELRIQGRKRAAVVGNYWTDGRNDDRKGKWERENECCVND
jgi:hypothetical protein